MKVGDRVKVATSIDSSNPAQHIGETGIVVKVGNGTTVEEMTLVELNNGHRDAYWPEELELI